MKYYDVRNFSMPDPHAKGRGVSNFLAYIFRENFLFLICQASTRTREKVGKTYQIKKILRFLKFMLDIISNVIYNQLNNSS